MHGRGLADTTAPPRQHSRCRRQSSMQSLPCPSSLPVALPMVGPLLLRGHSASTRSGWGTPEFPDASTRGLRNRIVRARLVLELAVIVVSGANDLVRSLSADVIGLRRRFRRFAPTFAVSGSAYVGNWSSESIAALKRRCGPVYANRLPPPGSVAASTSVESGNHLCQ